MSGDHDVKLYEQNGVWTLLNEQTIGASSLDACFLQCYRVSNCDLLALAVGTQRGEEQNCLVTRCRTVQQVLPTCVLRHTPASAANDSAWRSTATIKTSCTFVLELAAATERA